MALRPRLFAFEIAWAEAAFGAIFPPKPRTALAHGIGQMKPGPFLDALLADIWLETALGLRATVWMIALAPLFVLGRFATIISLDEDEREILLDRLLSSRVYAVRQLVAGFKTMGSLLISQSADIRKQMSTPVREELKDASSLVRVKSPSASAKTGAGVDHAA